MLPCSPARCVITVKDVQPPAITLQFSHHKYGTLYRKFLDRTATNDGTFTYECPIENDDRVITIRSTGSAALMQYVEGQLVFASETDAEAWEKRMALCGGLESIEKRSILRELGAKTFQQKLQISDEDWDKAWQGAARGAKRPGSGRPRRWPRNQRR